jgi:DnaK suppressor protein
VRWELNRALLEQSRERATSLEEALARASQGTYGICEQCGNPIHPDRLAVLPGVRVCIRCAQAAKLS